MSRPSTRSRRRLAPTDEIHSRASRATSSTCAPDKGGFAAIGGTLATTSPCGGQEERGGEAEDGHEADEAATVVEGLRHHRVGEHREDRAGGGCLDAGDQGVPRATE